MLLASSHMIKIKQNPHMNNTDIINLLKTIPNNDILHSFIKRIESLIHSNSKEHCIKAITNTYDILLIIINTFNKKASIRFNDEKTLNFKQFYDQYKGHFDNHQSNEFNLIHSLIDLECALYNKDILNKDDKVTILSNVHNFYSHINDIYTYSSNDHILYCYCKKPYNGQDMIACDNKNCKIEWFHLACVDLDKIPDDKWYCNECKNVMKK